MKNKPEFTIVLPYRSNSTFIDSCKRYLKQNTTHQYELLEIIDQPLVYTNFNNGVKQASCDTVIIMHDDMIFSKGWDEPIIKYRDPKLVMTMQVVEPGNVGVDSRNHFFNAGLDPSSFNYDAFELHVNALRGGHFNGEIYYDTMGWYMPVVFHKSTYIPYPTEPEYPHPNDITLMNQLLPDAGFRFALVNSYVYHFQSGIHRQMRSEK